MKGRYFTPRFLKRKNDPSVIALLYNNAHGKQSANPCRPSLACTSISDWLITRNDSSLTADLPFAFGMDPTTSFFFFFETSWVDPLHSSVIILQLPLSTNKQIRCSEHHYDDDMILWRSVCVYTRGCEVDRWMSSV